MASNIRDISLSIKLPLIISTITLVVALSLSLYNYLSSSSEHNILQQERLSSAASMRKQAIEHYLESIDKDLSVAAHSPFVANAIRDFSKAWNDLGNKNEQVLQKAYITDNPNPTGEKDKLVAAAGGTVYDEQHARYHPWFRTLLKERGYYDIFLFDLKGNLVYTVFKEMDYATNLVSGRWNDSDLGKIYRDAQGSPDGAISFYDFKPYAPSANAPASFIAMPVYDNGEKIGVLAFQMPIDAINTTMSASANLGKTGETLLIGADGYMRNNSAFTKDVDDILTTKINTIPLQSGSSEQLAEVKGYRDAHFFSVADQFDFHGVKYSVLAIQDYAELNAPLIAMRNAAIIITSILLIISIGVAILTSRMIASPIKQLVDGASELARGNTNVTFDGLNRKDEIGAIASAISGFRNNVEEQKKLAGETEKNAEEQRQRQTAIEQLIAGFQTNVAERLQNLSNNADTLRSVATEMSSQARGASERSVSVSSASEEASSNVRTVAAASEELSASIGEIDNQIAQANSVIDQATNTAKVTSQKVIELSEASQKIGSVISLIQDIAEQTNLLALNATIEAARAGEMGKGFAVVASEVKELANQTSKATEEISQQISAIQGSTSDAAQDIQSISQVMEDVTSYTSAIAEAISQQGVATSEISSNVQQAAIGTEQVNENMMGVQAAITETSTSADTTLVNAKDVTEETEHLRQSIEDFLRKVAAA